MISILNTRILCQWNIINNNKKDEKNELNITLSFAGNCTKSKCTHQIHLAAYIDSKKFKVLDNSSRNNNNKVFQKETKQQQYEQNENFNQD